MASSLLKPAASITELVSQVRAVVRPPTWRAEPYTLTYLMTQREVNASELIALLRWAHDQQMPNPRVITPTLLRWSSLFHPRFYKSIQDSTTEAIRPLAWSSSEVPEGLQALSRMWLQSVLFLSGVTLSAAMIQSRYSSGTIGSKFDRLWDAGTLAGLGVAPELQEMDLHVHIQALAKKNDYGLPMLLQLRELFMNALKQIAPASGHLETLSRTDVLPEDRRFGFLEELQQKLGPGLQAVVVYGSSVSSAHYADIDALIIIDDPVLALRQLAGSSPSWRGKELNLGVYSPDELLIMQQLSGDNLSDYGLCIYGEVQVVRKPTAALLARNFSFGVVRQRQQFGMLSRETGVSESGSADRINLNEYFVKIPANVTKGTFGAVGQRLPKEYVHDWLNKTVGFDTPAAQAQAARGDVIGALAHSALATGQALQALNDQLNVVRDADTQPRKQGALHHECNCVVG